MDPVKDLLGLTADYAAQFLGSLDERPVRASATIEELRAALGGPLPEQGLDETQVVAELIDAAGPGIIAIPSGRFFGFVIGGALPAALAADWLTSTWDQNGFSVVSSPAASAVTWAIWQPVTKPAETPAGSCSSSCSHASATSSTTPALGVGPIWAEF